jgi:DNA polymerase-1
MSKTPKLLLIDGSNLCFREFWSKKNLSHKGKAVDILFGAFKSISSYHKEWPDHFRVIAWEGGYKRRLEESEEAKEKGIVPESYKENRRKQRDEKSDAELEPLFEQMDQLRDEAFPLTSILQARVKGYEADDVINTYAKWAEERGGEAIIVSSDKDFYQCLSPNVKVYDARAKEMWTEERFEVEFGFSPKLWVDVGAIEGEVGPSKDNIFGVDGWGISTAVKYMKKYGSIEAIQEGLGELEPHIEKKSKKGHRGKKEEVFVNSSERLRLARSLKQMDIVPGVPKLRISHNTSEAELKKYFLQYGFASLLKDAWRFV